MDVDLENDSDDIDIGSSGAGLEEPSSRGHSWKHVLLVLHQNPKRIQHLLVSSRADDLEFDVANYDADLFSPPPLLRQLNLTDPNGNPR